MKKITNLIAILVISFTSCTKGDLAGDSNFVPTMIFTANDTTDVNNPYQEDFYSTDGVNVRKITNFSDSTKSVKITSWIISNNNQLVYGSSKNYSTTDSADLFVAKINLSGLSNEVMLNTSTQRNAYPKSISNDNRVIYSNNQNINSVTSYKIEINGANFDTIKTYQIYTTIERNFTENVSKVLWKEHNANTNSDILYKSDYNGSNKTKIDSANKINFYQISQNSITYIKNDSLFLSTNNVITSLIKADNIIALKISSDGTNVYYLRNNKIFSLNINTKIPNLLFSSNKSISQFQIL